MNDKEREVLNHLACAWNDFIQLEEQHPLDVPEFCKAIHDAQKIIALRIARKANPEFWVNNEKSV